jgi:hypothetical protein
MAAGSSNGKGPGVVARALLRRRGICAFFFPCATEIFMTVKTGTNEPFSGGFNAPTQPCQATVGKEKNRQSVFQAMIHQERAYREARKKA